MTREGVDRKDSGCCPGHDKFPDQTYGNRRSERARSRLKKVEHQRARRRAKRILDDLMMEELFHD